MCRLIVALVNKLFVYSFEAKPVRLYAFDTAENKYGRIAAGPGPRLVFPGRTKGQVQLLNLSDSTTWEAPATLLSAHDSTIACLALSADGHMLATASEKGTLLRVFDLASRKRVAEFRRGAEQAEIYSYEPVDAIAMNSS